MQQGVFDLWWLFAEVANGTVEQYLSNSTAAHTGAPLSSSGESARAERFSFYDGLRRYFPTGPSRLTEKQEWRCYMHGKTSTLNL